MNGTAAENGAKEHMETITSLQNARIKEWTKLHNKKDRDVCGCFLVEGEHLIQEALKENCVDVIITDQDCPLSFTNTVMVTPAIMKKLSANVSAVHLIAVCHKKKWEKKEMKRVVLLDGVQDPGNLGTLVRTAQSFCFDAVICSHACADLYNEKTVRSTQGALFHQPVFYEDLNDAITMLQQDHFAIIGTSLQSSVPMASIDRQDKMAFVLGNEGNGVSSQILAMCDKNMRIEMSGFESLNVAVAGGIIMYHFRP
ncbi:MAG: RNA methyltransferase [Lactimicrobium sp.]|uniref:TrmH family RNA methyltransferase n=1 Tax=Lactimicrobium sp. TaxID=2563780 RepID=UPI002F35C285